jgi:RNA polymerase sigma-70 factor (ECF subfamily)
MAGEEDYLWWMVHAMLETVSRPNAPVDVVRVDREFQRVLTEFGPSLTRLTLGYELDAEARRDLLQDIHVAIWRSLAIFDSRCSLRTWVYRVAHNTAVKHVVRAKRRGLVDLKNLDEIDEPADPRNEEREWHREMALQRLALLIAQLKPLDRQVILLYIEDVPAEEIAEITGLSRGSVGVRVHRIKQLLMKMFGTGAPDGPRR